MLAVFYDVNLILHVASFHHWIVRTIHQSFNANAFPYPLNNLLLVYYVASRRRIKMNTLKLLPQL